ncbi:class I SAM-dependent methyltransferase [Erwinia sp. E_sp_B01_9]|uniref:class I SAM-dependent methyltransferase n=1 Tax=Erwinia sp. E_sp_B01_9 TaxID=3039403 RepID=UPI003D9BA03B
MNKGNVEGHGMDFSQEAVSLAKKYYPQLAERFSQKDAFNLDFADNHFDMSYHNGFWVLFDDENIKKLAVEQARVTRDRMIVTVHNGHNKEFKRYFDSKSATDTLFNIRFFECEEITALMKTVCQKVTIIPVGKGKKRHEDFLIRKGLGHPAILKAYFDLSRQALLDQSERLMCIGELQK